MELGVKTHFHAAHSLPNHEGKCKQLHGHTYHVEIRFEGGVRHYGAASGMVMDFGEARRNIDSVISEFDHKNLNDFMHNPTAENLIVVLWAKLYNVLFDKVTLTLVRLYETENCYVQITNC